MKQPLDVVASASPSRGCPFSRPRLPPAGYAITAWLRWFPDRAVVGEEDPAGVEFGQPLQPGGVGGQRRLQAVADGAQGMVARAVLRSEVVRLSENGALCEKGVATFGGEISHVSQGSRCFHRPRESRPSEASSRKKISSRKLFTAISTKSFRVEICLRDDARRALACAIWAQLSARRALPQAPRAVGGAERGCRGRLAGPSAGAAGGWRGRAGVPRAIRGMTAGA